MLKHANLDRDALLLKIRPELSNVKIGDNMHDDELFQNNTLRPVIKTLHGILVGHMKEFMVNHGMNVKGCTSDEISLFIENAIVKNIAFRNFIYGLVVGNFTSEEFNYYSAHSSSINKRITGIVKQRLIDSLEAY